MVAEINRGLQIFLGAPVILYPPPPILVLKVIFVKLLRKPKLYTKFEVVRFNSCENE